jgi:hypothetical protein
MCGHRLSGAVSSPPLAQGTAGWLGCPPTSRGTQIQETPDRETSASAPSAALRCPAGCPALRAPTDYGAWRWATIIQSPQPPEDDPTRKSAPTQGGRARPGTAVSPGCRSETALLADAWREGALPCPCVSCASARRRTKSTICRRQRGGRDGRRRQARERGARSPRAATHGGWKEA